MRSYPDPSTKVQLSTGGAGAVSWALDGSAVYFVAGAAAVVEARVRTSPTFSVVSRDSAFKVAFGAQAASNGLYSIPYAPTRDKNRILTIVAEVNRYELIASPNWLAEFRERVKPSGKK